MGVPILLILILILGISVVIQGRYITKERSTNFEHQDTILRKQTEISNIRNHIPDLLLKIDELRKKKPNSIRIKSQQEVQTILNDEVQELIMHGIANQIASKLLDEKLIDFEVTRNTPNFLGEVDKYTIVGSVNILIDSGEVKEE